NYFNNDYSCDYSSPSNDNYCSSYTTADQDTSTYTYTATAPADNRTEQQEITTLSFSDRQCEIPENYSTKDHNITTYMPASDTTEEYTPTTQLSDIIETREVLNYKIDDVVHDDNNYSCDYSSPNNYDYGSATADQDTSTYAYTATAPEDDWSEQHEVTALSFSDTHCEIPENNSSENYNTTTDTPNGEAIVECTTTGRPSSGIIGSREILDYRTDDVTIPIHNFPREREYVPVREYYGVSSSPPRIHRYEHLNHVSSQFQRECQALDQIDSSKLSHAEFIQYTKRYAEVLDAEEKRQNQKRKEKQECKNILVVLISILCGLLVAAALIFKISMNTNARL
ncbi:hypothetical protein TSAR_003489, partial [Trichomalopsis sarcophagae]